MTLLRRNNSAKIVNVFLILAFGIQLLTGHDCFAEAQTSVSSTSAPASYGTLPLSFEANRGQSDASVQFLSRGGDYSIFLTGKGAVLDIGKPVLPAQSAAVARDIFRMTLAGASELSAGQISGEDQLPGEVNYFLGNDPARWHSGIPTYGKVRYTGVYPGVDLVYYGNGHGNQSQLEYDFLVAPGADPGSIRLEFSGQKRLSIHNGGDLILRGANGQATFHRPVVYQEKDGRRQPISGRFELAANRSVRFRVGVYDHTRPLIIDPILVYSTYLGGSGWTDHYNEHWGDQGNAIAADAAGNAYVVGTAYSSDFPVTAGSYQTVNKEAPGSGNNGGNGSAVFVSKLNPAGTALLYSTYLGGSGQNIAGYGFGDSGNAIAVDSSGNAYITGTTFSVDFPVTAGAFQTTPAAMIEESSAFVVKLNPTGSALIYSTYLGSSGGVAEAGNAGNAIAVDSSGHAYVAGHTYSGHFPVTAGAFQTAAPGAIQSGNASGFVTKLNPTGTALAYSTYLGGSGGFKGDDVTGLAIDSAGDAYVTGYTYSNDFPVTAGAFQTANPAAANSDVAAFVTKLNPAGSAPVYSTYLGGSGETGAQLSPTPREASNAIAVDRSGAAYVAGFTQSTDFPVTPGALVTACQYGSGFVTKLNPAGSAPAYSTCLNLGYPIYSVNGLAVDASGQAYLTGLATITGFSTTPDAVAPFLPYLTGDPLEVEAVVAKLNATGSAIEYATYLGDGTGAIPLYGVGISSTGIGIAVNSNGVVFVTGQTIESGFPTSSGALQTSYNGAALGVSNAFVSALNLASDTAAHFLTQTALHISPTTALHGQPVTLTAQIGPLPGTSAPPTPVAYSGSVTFYGNEDYPSSAYLQPNPTVPVDASGVATWTTSSLPRGTYYVSASYSGDGAHLSSNSYNYWATGYGQVILVVFGPPTTIAATSSPEPQIVYGQTFPHPLSVQVSDSYGDLLPGLSVNFSGAGLSFTSSPAPTNSQGQAVAAVQALAAGSLTATASVAGLAQTVAFPLKISPAPLTVTLHNAYRAYGAANPVFPVKVSGLIGSDAVTVTPQTSATASSPVGAYPITATVTGPAASNYSATVYPATLQVIQVPLNITARNVAITYGQTPPPITQYFLTGFVNGDNASVVSGAPVLSTTVTSATPVGFYKIGVQDGTLSAANYYFVPFSSGEGSVGVYKAPLKATANNLTMTQGGPVPTLTYTLSGFVNGQTSGVVTGAPNLSTTATSASAPGHYRITLSTGTLSAQNYAFTPAPGVLTVLP